MLGTRMLGDCSCPCDVKWVTYLRIYQTLDFVSIIIEQRHSMDNSSLPQGVTAQTISLWYGHPDPTTLDTPEFQEAVRRVMDSPQISRTLAYGNEQGNVELINYLVGRINREQHLNLTAENLMITAGSTSAVDMIARLY